MDMEEYFMYTQNEIKEMINKIEVIWSSEYHPDIIETKKNAIAALKKLYDKFEF
jgi:hypothetical protein